MLNNIVVMGRLTTDPELRTTGSGTPVASFTLAVDRDRINQSTGERECDFIDIVAWRGTAEFAARNLSKGRAVIVTGRLQIRRWQDKDGNNRRSAEVVAASIYFGDTRPKDEKQEATPVTNGFDVIVDDDNELPF